VREFVYGLAAVSPLDGEFCSLILPWVGRLRKRCGRIRSWAEPGELMWTAEPGDYRKWLDHSQSREEIEKIRDAIQKNRR
jgi:hypothetical protein